MLIGSSMSMLADGVGSLDGARRILSAIWKSNNNDSNDDNKSRIIGSKSQTSKSFKSTNDTYEDMLCDSICGHGESVLQFAKMKAEESPSEKNRKHAEAKEKQKRSDAVD